MSKTKQVNMWLDEEEYALFMEAMIEYENVTQNGRVSIGKFMRDIVLPMFNIENTPNVWDQIRKYDRTYQEIVSKQSQDTDSANSKNSIPDSEQKNVSPASEDTILEKKDDPLSFEGVNFD